MPRRVVSPSLSSVIIAVTPTSCTDSPSASDATTAPPKPGARSRTPCVASRVQGDAQRSPGSGTGLQRVEGKRKTPRIDRTGSTRARHPQHPSRLREPGCPGAGHRQPGSNWDRYVPGVAWAVTAVGNSSPRRVTATMPPMSRMTSPSPEEADHWLDREVDREAHLLTLVGRGAGIENQQLDALLVGVHAADPHRDAVETGDCRVLVRLAGRRRCDRKR